MRRVAGVAPNGEVDDLYVKGAVAEANGFQALL
jgi:hypothetical protein